MDSMHKNRLLCSCYLLQGGQCVDATLHQSKKSSNTINRDRNPETRRRTGGRKGQGEPPARSNKLVVSEPVVAACFLESKCDCVNLSCLAGIQIGTISKTCSLANSLSLDMKLWAGPKDFRQLLLADA